MIKFIKYLTVQIMNKYGSFMWFGAHIGVTQVDWHYLLEIFLCLLINFLMIFSVYLEWKDIEDEKLQKNTNT